MDACEYLCERDHEIFVILCTIFSKDLRQYAHTDLFSKAKTARYYLPSGAEIKAVLEYENDRHPRITFYCPLDESFRKEYILHGWYYYLARPEEKDRYIGSYVSETPVGQLGPLTLFYRPEGRDMPNYVSNWAYYSDYPDDQDSRLETVLSKWLEEVKSEYVLARLAV